MDRIDREHQQKMNDIDEEYQRQKQIVYGRFEEYKRREKREIQELRDETLKLKLGTAFFVLVIIYVLYFHMDSLKDLYGPIFGLKRKKKR